MKCEFIKTQECDLIGTVFMDEGVWWNNYYRQLEVEINSTDSKQFKD